MVEKFSPEFWLQSIESTGSTHKRERFGNASLRHLEKSKSKKFLQDLLPLKALFSTVKTKRRKSYKDIDRHYSLYKYIPKKTYQYSNHRSHIVIRLCHRCQGIIYHRYNVAIISCIYCALFRQNLHCHKIFLVPPLNIFIVAYVHLHNTTEHHVLV